MNRRVQDFEEAKLVRIRNLVSERYAQGDEGSDRNVALERLRALGYADEPASR